jgi:hypothetical protein
VVSNVGIPDPDNLAKATEEYVYFATTDGIYLFNGVRAEKMSYKIDPFILHYNQSRCVLGYQRERLYLSYPDSDVTFIYNEPLQAWTGPMDFGMTCICTLPDTNIIYFGMHKYKGRVFYYPSSVYSDQSPTQSVNPTVEYQSGWQSFGGYWLNKQVNEGFFPISTLGNVRISVWADFDTIACVDDTTNHSGRYVYRPQFTPDCVGEYFKVNIQASSGANAIIQGYRLLWEEILQYQK